MFVMLFLTLVHLTKEDDQNSFVKERQHGGYCVKCVRPLSTTQQTAKTPAMTAVTIQLYEFSSKSY